MMLTCSAHVTKKDTNYSHCESLNKSLTPRLSVTKDYLTFDGILFLLISGKYYPKELQHPRLTRLCYINCTTTIRQISVYSLSEQAVLISQRWVFLKYDSVS